MSEETSSIHEFDFNLICEYFSLLQRQGPGADDQTQLALHFIDGLNPQSRIADLGCGTGASTLTLAKHTPGCITALDLFPTFIELLKQRIANAGLEERVSAICGDMSQLPFQKKELDLIWCEGAIYNIGFQRGMQEWNAFLKKGGYIAVTEVAWLTDTRPSEVEQFWLDAYPEIDTIAHKIEQMQQAGYLPVASFVLPEYCWTTQFYEPQKQTQEAFLLKHAGNQTAEELVKNQRYEALMYQQYKSYYGYVFFIGKSLI